MGQRRLQQKINKQKLSLRSKVGEFKKDLLFVDFFFESSAISDYIVIFRNLMSVL